MLKETRRLGEMDIPAAQALQIIESMAVATAWVTDARGMFTYISPGAVELVGATVDDFNAWATVTEFGWIRVVHPDDYDRVADEWRRCVETGDEYDVDVRLRRADGAYSWFRCTGRPVRDAEGAITSWFGTAFDIDAQKRIEAELRERERELSQLVDMAPSHVWRLRPDGEPTFFNRRMVDFLGLDVSDVDEPGKTRLRSMIHTAVHPTDAAAFEGVLSRCLITGETFSMRYRLRRADGAYRWMSSRAEPMRDEEGRIVQWYGLCHDIDDQMRAEEALRERERELSLLVDMVPVNIGRMTPDGEPTFFNKRAVESIGLDDLEAFDNSGMSRLAAMIAAQVHPEDGPRMREVMSRSLITGGPYTIRYRRRRADGVYRWMEGRAEPLRDENGAIVQWYAAAIDIDDQVNVEETLRQSERQLQEMIDAVPVRIWSAPSMDGPLYFNKRYQDYLRSVIDNFDTLGEASIETFLQELVHPEDAPRVKGTLWRCFEGGDDAVMRFRWRESDGGYRWAECRVEPRRDHDGAVLQWYGVSLDIDDEVRAQEALRDASNKLARAAQAASLAELSASIAHEVNQPLAAIVANSHACERWLSAEPPNVARAKITAAHIIRDANSAAEVVARIRALFRQSVEARTSAAIASVIAEAHAFVAEEAARRGVRITIDVEKGLPLVPCDRVQVQQVLINLVRNGMDAMDGLPGERIVQLRARRTGQKVQIETSDRGPGVASPDRIFEPFFTTKPDGMGMGLAICRSTIERHGGRLWAEENKPNGAKFVFTLPFESRVAP